MNIFHPLRIFRAVKIQFIFIFVMLLSIANVNCVQQKRGSPADAFAARVNIEDGRAFLAQVKAETDALLARLSGVLIAKMLFLEPSAGGAASVGKIDVEAAYGVFTETAAGVYNFTAGIEPQIVVEYLNGVTMTMHSFTFVGTPEVVSSFKGDVLSDQRAVLTPAAEWVEIHAQAQRPELAENLNAFAPASVTLAGTVSYNRPLGKVLYDIKRATGELNFSVIGTSQKISRIAEFTVVDLTNTTVNAPFWSEVETLLYYPTTVGTLTTLTWAAASLSISYRDYTGSEGIIGASQNVPNLIGPNVSFVGEGTASFQNRDVADVVGGPYSCSLGNPDNVGFGTEVVLAWFDDINQTVVPSVDFPCNRVVIRQPL